VIYVLNFLKECKEKNINGILIYEDSANPQYEPISEIVKFFRKSGIY